MKIEELAKYDKELILCRINEMNGVGYIDLKYHTDPSSFEISIATSKQHQASGEMYPLTPEMIDCIEENNGNLSLVFPAKWIYPEKSVSIQGFIFPFTEKILIGT